MCHLIRSEVVKISSAGSASVGLRCVCGVSRGSPSPSVDDVKAH